MLTKFQIKALQLVDTVNYNMLTRRQVTSLTKAGLIESENGEYVALTETGIEAIKQIKKEDIYNRVMGYNIWTLLDQLGLHFQHSYYVDFDLLDCEDEMREEYINQMKYDLIDKMCKRL